MQPTGHQIKLVCGPLIEDQYTIMAQKIWLPQKTQQFITIETTYLEHQER